MIKMTKQEIERIEIIKEGYRIFADAVNYSDDELVGYVRVVNGIIGNTDTCEDRNILISQLIKAINTLSEVQQYVLTLRYGLNKFNPMTIKDIGNKLQQHPETISKHEYLSLVKLRRKANIYIISIIKQEKDVELSRRLPSNILIQELGFSVRTFNCLKRSNIHTVEDLLNFPEDKFLQIRNLGKKSLKEILEKKQEFLKKFSNTN